tara:strand:- start:1017 stop:1556 length:540 start_codon:yes stop_codon:yes gene_type:complete
MILGLDISTSITGVTVISEDDEILLNEAWDLRKYKNFFDKANFVNQQIVKLTGERCFDIRSVFIEQSLQSFRSGFSSAKTLSTLSRFNGVVSWMVYKEFGIEPQYIAATSARRLCGIKVPRGIKAKQFVMNYLIENEPNFAIEYTKFGNPKPEYYDRADSLVIARAGLQEIRNNNQCAS